MNRIKSFFCLLVMSAVFSSTGCSGVQSGGVVPPPVTGTASLALTMTATPLTPPPGTSILSFSVNISSISLNPTTGTAVSIPLNTGTGTLTVDLTRLQSDSALLGVAAAVPAGSYSSIAISLASPVLTYCTVNTGTPGCVPGSITTILPSAAVPQVSTTLSLTANQQAGLALDVNLNKVLTLGAAQSVFAADFTATGALTAVTLPRASSLAATQFDFIEDITGTVSGVSGQVVTMQTATHGTFAATATSTTVFAPPACPNADITCVHVGQVASIDAALNADGTFALLQFAPIDTSTTTQDWIEGVITANPTSATQFQLVTNELVLAPTSLVGAGLAIGSPVQVNLGAGATFGIDTKGLSVPVPQSVAFASAVDTSLLLPGQTVAVRVSGFTIATSTGPAQATASRVVLRFTRVAATILASAPPTTITLQNLPPFFGLATNPLVELSSGTGPNLASTNYDGVSSASGIVAGSGQTYSIRALYLGGAAEPFTAAKVRAN